MGRFVVLYHDSPSGSHFDLMFELGEVLKTWSLPHPPEGEESFACRLLPDHRLAYLDYEGPVSNHRGTVTRWDQGTYEVIEQCEKRWCVEISGKKLAGKLELSLTGQDPPPAATWLLQYRSNTDSNFK